MKPNLFPFQQELTRVSAAVATARAQIRRARTLRQVVDAMDVGVRAEYRCLRHLMTDLRRLPALAERRAEDILRAQLAVLHTIADETERRHRLAHYRGNDWRLLGGRFPRLVRLVELASRTDKHSSVGTAKHFPETVGMRV